MWPGKVSHYNLSCVVNCLSLRVRADIHVRSYSIDASFAQLLISDKVESADHSILLVCGLSSCPSRRKAHLQGPKSETCEVHCREGIGEVELPESWPIWERK